MFKKLKFKERESIYTSLEFYFITPKKCNTHLTSNHKNSKKYI